MSNEQIMAHCIVHYAEEGELGFFDDLLNEISKYVERREKERDEARRLAEECRDNLRMYLLQNTFGPTMPDMTLPWEVEK